jgi:integrase
MSRAQILVGVSAAINPTRSCMAREYPGVYAYPTKQGTRYRYNFRDSDGKLSCKRGFRSPQAAAIDKAGANVQAAAGTLHLSTARFADYFESWLAGHRPFVDAGTWNDYRTHGCKRLIPAFGDRRLDEIATADVREWLAEASRAGIYKPKTLNNALGVLVVCLNQAADDRLLQTNPAAHVKRLPLGHAEREYLRIHEIDLYLSCCSTTYRPLAELLISCGLRISEALGLIWEDIDLATGTITVNRQAKGARGQTGSTKGRRARSVEAGPYLLRALTDLNARQGEHQTVLRRQPVFTMPVRRSKAQAGRWPSAGAPTVIDRNTVTRDWHKAALRDAGLRDMPLHALRHTAAATWLYCGQPLIYVQRALGHASITTTESFYGHLEQSLLKTAARDTEAAVRSAGRGAAHR